MKAEINYKEKIGKKTDTWRLNNMQLRNQRGYKKYSEINEYGNTTFQYLWDTENPKDEVHSNKGLLHETRKITNTQSKYTFKETRETGKC